MKKYVEIADCVYSKHAIQVVVIMEPETMQCECPIYLIVVVTRTENGIFLENE